MNAQLQLNSAELMFGEDIDLMSLVSTPGQKLAML